MQADLLSEKRSTGPGRVACLIRCGVAAILAVLLAWSPFEVPARQTPMVAPRPAPIAESEADAIEHVRIDALRIDVERLTAPSMEGRGTGQPGGERAADFIASRFKDLGLKPLGDKGSYKQAAPLAWELLGAESQMLVGATRLAVRRDFVVVPPFTFEQLNVTAELVFVGYGVQSKELSRFDLSDLDLNGKVAVLLAGQPPGVAKDAWERATAPAVRLRSLLERGAVGIVFLGAGSDRQPFAELADYYSRRRLELASTERPPDGLPPIILMGDSGAESLVRAAGASYREYRTAAEAGKHASRSIGKNVSLQLSSTRGTCTGYNVAGFLEGSDSGLHTEAVALMAHYDAYGLDAGGTIFPGAADNALGVAEMLGIASAVSNLRVKPKRSLVFLAFTGEEYGGLGSQFWIEHPTWPLPKLVAALNFDGIGTEVFGPVRSVVGHGSEHSTLGARLREAAGSCGISMVPDPMPEEESFFRSDHLFFAQQGIPCLMLQGLPDADPTAIRERARRWIESDYHRPTDTVKGDWDWGGVQTLARVGAVLTIRLADSGSTVRASWFDNSPFHPTRRAEATP